MNIVNLSTFIHICKSLGFAKQVFFAGEGVEAAQVPPGSREAQDMS